MYVTDDGQKLLGDLVDVPKWLADILASAYPNRSIEGRFKKEVNGHEYRLVITDLSLLGVVWPGVSSLADLQSLYSKEGPEDVKVIEAKEGENMTVQASVSAEDIRRAFYDDVAVDARTWWWICAQYVDPPLIIADDGSGEIYSVPYSIKGDEVTFADPAVVKIQYVEEDSGKVAANESGAVAIFASRAESVRDIPLQKGEIRCRVYS
jgi:hypothetical protein